MRINRKKLLEKPQVLEKANSPFYLPFSKRNGTSIGMSGQASGTSMHKSESACEHVNCVHMVRNDKTCV